jgi:hypothetical protein
MAEDWNSVMQTKARLETEAGFPEATKTLTWSHARRILVSTECLHHGKTKIY